MGDFFTLDAEPIPLADVPGFRTGVSACGLAKGGPDIGVLLCDSADGAGTAVLAKNAVLSASTRISSPRAASGRLRAAVVNAGNSNCLTGEDGLRDAREMVSIAASGLGVPQEQILLASSGPMGTPLDMALVRKGLEAACKNALEGGRGDFAAVLGLGAGRSWAASASGQIDGKPFRLAGVARYADPSAPDATMVLAFLATDAAVRPDCLREILFAAAGRTFGRFVLDGGPGVGDTICMLASGRLGNDPIDNVFSAGVLSEALEAVSAALVAGRGDDQRSPLEATVTGAASERDAELAAQALVSSVLLRAALRSGEPDWGLVLAAAGRSGARVEEARATVRFAGEVVFERGKPAKGISEELKRRLGPGAKVELDLGLGSASARMWACALGSGGGGEKLLALERSAREAEERARELEKKAREAETRRSEAEAAQGSLAEKLKAAESAREAAEKELSGLRKRLDVSEQAREATAKEVGELRAQIVKLSESAKAAGRVKDLESKLEKAEAARSSLEKDVTSLRKRLEAADEARAAAAKEAEGLRGQVKKLSESAKAAEREKDLESRLKQAESAREAAEKELSGLKKRMEASAKELEALRAELKRKDEELARLQSLTAEAERLRAESKRMSARLEAAQSEIEQAKVQVSLKDQLVKQLLAENDEYQKLTKAHKELIAKVEAVERKAAEADSLRAELQKLKAEMASAGKK